MKNWVISENNKVVCKVGEFLIQVTTVEYILVQIYDQFIVKVKKTDKFSGLTLGVKISELSKKVKIGNVQKEIKSIEEWKNKKRETNIATRLFLLNNFRNKIAHNALEYNPIDKQVYVKSENILNELDNQILHVNELLSDLHIVLLSIKDPKMKNYKEVITF